jgi:hypothetical protein
MERAVALKKLRKILGDSLGYRVDPKAPDADERAELLAKLKVERTERDALGVQREARMQAILEADDEYQRLKAAYSEAKKHCDELMGIAYSYRFTVGISGKLFFTVKAQGDSWEDVIAKLTEKQPA